jgi:Skp family chaperone for outer membrane proteins
MTRTVFAALLAAAICAGVAASALSQDRPVPTKLGFVDIKKAFETYRKRKDVQDQLKTKSDALSAQFKARAAQIEQDGEKLNTLNPGTDEYQALTRSIDLAKYTLDLDKKMKLRELDAEQRKKHALIYREICQESKAYGTEQGLAAVMLFIPAEADIEQDLDIIVSTRAVLCHDDQLDVTKEVVERLNRELPPAPVAPQPDDPGKKPK